MSTFLSKPAIPKLDLGKLAIGGLPVESKENEDVRSARLINSFRDFWEGKENEPPMKVPKSAREFRIADEVHTKQPLQVFKVATPPQSPRASAIDIARGCQTTRESYVPHWPFWSSGRAPTTLCLENLPRDCIPEVIVQRLDKLGFAGRYDFVSCPSESRAVVNGVRHADACALARCLHNFYEWDVPCHKPRCCKVSWNLSHQGLECLILQQQIQQYPCWGGGPWIRMLDQWKVMPQVAYSSPLKPSSARGRNAKRRISTEAGGVLKTPHKMADHDEGRRDHRALQVGRDLETPRKLDAPPQHEEQPTARTSSSLTAREKDTARTSSSLTACEKTFMKALKKSREIFKLEELRTSGLALDALQLKKLDGKRAVFEELQNSEKALPRDSELLERNKGVLMVVGTYLGV